VNIASMDAEMFTNNTGHQIIETGLEIRSEAILRSEKREKMMTAIKKSESDYKIIQSLASGPFYFYEEKTRVTKELNDEIQSFLLDDSLSDKDFNNGAKVLRKIKRDDTFCYKVPQCCKIACMFAACCPIISFSCCCGFDKYRVGRVYNSCAPDDYERAHDNVIKAIVLMERD